MDAPTTVGGTLAPSLCTQTFTDAKYKGMLLAPQAAVVLGVVISGGGEASAEVHVVWVLDENKVGLVQGSLLDDDRRHTGALPLSQAVRVFHTIRAVDALVARVRQRADCHTKARWPLFFVIESNYAYGEYLYSHVVLSTHC